MGWQHRYLLASFIRREISERYARSVAGAAWAMAHPLALLAVYAFVFTRVFQVALPPGSGEASYVAFVAIGLWPWLMFAEALERATGALEAHASLLHKVAFPAEIVVIASVLGCFVVHTTGFLIVLLALKLLGQPLHLSGLASALPALISLVLAAMGVGLLLASFQIFLPDTRQVVSVLLTLLFFATPVLYPRLLVPDAFRPWMDLNPIGRVLERLRALLLAPSGPAASDIVTLAGAAAICALGWIAFRRVSPHLKDFL